MLVTRLFGLDVRYRLDGPAGAPVVVLSHALGTDLGMWEPQVAALAGRFRVLRYDTRGHGGTSVPAEPFAIDQLGRDVVALLDQLAVPRVAFCGLSMGGLVGMWLGAHAAERVDRLVLCNTGARIGTADGWNTRIDAVRTGGMAEVAAGVMERWFTTGFRERAPQVVERTRATFVGTSPQGYAACCAAIRDADLGADLGAISATTLVVAGSADPATTPADGRRIADAVRGARYVELDAAHLSNLEAAEAWNATVVDFLTAAGS